MNKTFLLLIYLLLSSAYASDLFYCNFNPSAGSGRVYLLKDFELNGTKYVYGHYVGQEDFIEVNKFRNKCDELARELNSSTKTKIEEDWAFYTCDHYRDIEVLHFKVSSENKSLNLFYHETKYSLADENIYRIASSSRCDD